MWPVPPLKSKRHLSTCVAGSMAWMRLFSTSREYEVAIFRECVEELRENRGPGFGVEVVRVVENETDRQRSQVPYGVTNVNNGDRPPGVDGPAKGAKQGFGESGLGRVRRLQGQPDIATPRVEPVLLQGLRQKRGLADSCAGFDRDEPEVPAASEHLEEAWPNERPRGPRRRHVSERQRHDVYLGRRAPSSPLTLQFVCPVAADVSRT